MYGIASSSRTLPPASSLLRMPRQPESYAERTYDSPHWIVRFPHRRRNSEMIKLVNEIQPKALLDYGAGAGRFVVDLLGSATMHPTAAVAYEPILEGVGGSIAENLDSAGLAGRVKLVRNTAELTGPFDLVVCMAVLEHLSCPARYQFYDTMDRVLAPGGIMAIDVPVEVGPAILLKNLGRRLLKKDVRQYESSELFRIGLGGTVFDPGRFEPHPPDDFIMWHRGFDHRLLRAEIASRFKILRHYNTPLNWLPTVFNQEIVLVATHC